MPLKSRPMIAFVCFLAFSLLGGLGIQHAAAQNNFSEISGTWNGMLDSRNGQDFDLSIRIQANGDYQWIRDGAVMTDGKLSIEGGEIRYANEIGSRGVVTWNGANQLTWVNRFTGNNYQVNVTR